MTIPSSAPGPDRHTALLTFAEGWLRMDVLIGGLATSEEAEWFDRSARALRIRPSRCGVVAEVDLGDRSIRIDPGTVRVSAMAIDEGAPFVPDDIVTSPDGGVISLAWTAADALNRMGGAVRLLHRQAGVAPACLL
ncbi:hypothetical protein [Azospirillum aestuarii]|nr:hypothetical protein [Azospirillum aestuarii]